MPARTRVTWINGVPRSPVGVFELREDGSHGPISLHSQQRIPAGLP
jgi:hypothetical protein